MAKDKIEIDLKKAIKRLRSDKDSIPFLDDKFITNFKACYYVLYEDIYDLAINKQVAITIKSMLIMVGSASNEVKLLLAKLIKTKILS